MRVYLGGQFGTILSRSADYARIAWDNGTITTVYEWEADNGIHAYYGTDPAIRPTVAWR